MYASVAWIKSVQILLSIAALMEWEIHLIDIDSIFLNSELPNGENIYLKSLQVMSSRERETISGFLSECSMA